MDTEDCCGFSMGGLAWLLVRHQSRAARLYSVSSWQDLCYLSTVNHS